MSMKKDTFLP